MLWGESERIDPDLIQVTTVLPKDTGQVFNLNLKHYMESVWVVYSVGL